MSSIYLVRHGQASFGKENYDHLSATGFTQSARLAKHFAGVTPTHLYRGSMLRHRQTCEGYATAAGVELAAQVHSGFNEFDHLDVIHRYRPEWEQRQKMLADIAASSQPGLFFQSEFSQAVRRWIAGEQDHDYKETWREFRHRVEEAFQEVMARSSGGQNILVFTSGGPVSVICAAVLGLDIKQTMSLNENIANASVTRILFQVTG